MARTRTIDVLISRHLSPEARAAKLAAFAKSKLAEAQARHAAKGGSVPPHETVVDRRRGAPVESVKPDGEIVFEFQLITAALVAIDDMLLKASPVRSGRYQRSHLLFADGLEVEPETAPADAAEFIFVNMQPYARKIETGLSPQAPDGVFEAVAALAARRFSNVARIAFTFQSAFGRRERADRQPAISVVPR